MSQGLFETLIKEEQQPFSGWDFSYLEGRVSFKVEIFKCFKAIS